MRWEPEPTLRKAFSLNHPRPGHYRVRLVRNGPLVPVRIFCICNFDPETGVALAPDATRWLACEIDGKPAHPEKAWPFCARHPITAEEYAFLVASAAWDREHAPASPAANPTSAIDLMRAPIPTF